MKKLITFLFAALVFCIASQGQTLGDFRSKAAGPGNWNDFNAWQIYNGTTWVAAIAGQLPTSTSATEIQATHSMILNSAALTSGNLTVNGTLNYHATTVSDLTVSGNVIVGPAGSFKSPASGTITTHALNINGDLTVNGIFNMNVFSTAGVVTTFTGATNNVIAGTGTTINFYSIVVNKGVVYTNVLDVTSVITMASPPISGGMFLTISNGTFKLSSASTLSPYAGTQTLLTANGRLWLNNAGAIVQSVGVGTAAGVGRCMITTGRLQITAGTFSYGSGSDVHSIGYTTTYLTLEGPSATMNLYGSMQLVYGLNFTMSAGNINIYPQAGNNLSTYWPVSMESYTFFATNYLLTGGTITIVDPTLVASGTYATSFNCSLTNGTFDLSGLTLRLGNGVSDKAGAAAGFSINSNVPIGNVIVNNSPASVLPTRVVKLSGAFSAGNLTINSGVANQFQLNGFVLTLVGNIVNSGTFNGDGNAANGIAFTGTTQQVISGAGTFTNNNINNITLASTSVASPSVDLRVPLSVSNSLTLTSGTLGTTNASVFTIGRLASSATFSMTRSGGSLAVIPAYALAGVTGNAFNYNAPTPAAAQTTGDELPPAFPITTFTINNTSGVTLNKAVSCTTLALTAGILTTTTANSITVTGTAVANITGGSATAYVNGPLTRTFPNNAVAANYKYFIGKAAYHLFEYATITTGGSGTATITAEVFDAGPYPGSPGQGMGTINTDKMWRLTGNLGSVTVTSSQIRITEPGMVATNRIGQSNSFSGQYRNIGGILGTGTIASRTPIDYSNLTTGTYFRIGTQGSVPAGTIAIGPFGPYAGYSKWYPNFQTAVDSSSDVAILGNVIFEFQPDYNASVEVYPVTMSSYLAGNISATLTFRPASTVVSLKNFTSAGTIIANTGADFVIIDGRPGGAGTNKFIQITNTGTTTPAISLTADALNNQFLYCILKGSNTTVASGILALSAPVTGNNNLTVNNCNFDGSGSASNCIYATGVSSGATLTFNNFFNYRNGGGINFASGSDNAIIDNNSFYQTTTYVGIAGTTSGIIIAGGINCQISNNNIGGSGPLLTGIWTVSATTPVVYNFTGINATGLGTTSKIYNNKIQNFDWKCNPATWTGINGSGTVNIGTDGANLIGSNTGNDNIKVTYYANGAAQINGILAGGTLVRVENNNIGSITTLLASGITGAGSSITGISASATNTVVNLNVIGSTTTTNNINAANQSTTGSTQNIYGIYAIASTSTITGNTVANLFSGMTFATGGMMKGIYFPNSAAIVTASANLIYSLSTPQPNISTGNSAVIIGIHSESTVATNLSISGNTIYDLVNTAAAGAVTVTGIFYSANANNSLFNNKVEKNIIHSISTASNTAIQNGIFISYGIGVFQNNVIRLGIDKNGASITTSAQINGFQSVSYTGSDYYFNTVYIGGSGVLASTVKTYAFNMPNRGGPVYDLRNNIFVNMRTNAVANKQHYAIGLPAYSAPWISDYNIYFVSGTDGILGSIAAVDMTLLGTFQETYQGNDLHSGFGDPLLTNPAAAMATMNLKPANFTPAEGNGIAIATVTDDFASLLRASYTPTDIGAYAGNYTPPGPGQDIFFPIITYNPLGNSSFTTTRTTHNFAAITDVYTGVNIAAGTKPRIYYKISTNANAFAGNTSANNGWKWVEANGTTSPFDFTLDYSILFGGPVVLGTVIQYFVVAQDLATVPNVSFKPSTGASGTSVGTAGMTAPTTPYSYKIVPLLPNTMNVGTGFTYLTLTGTGGLFDAINNSVIDGNTVATIKTDMIEPGTVALNLVSEQGAGEGTLTLKIQSDGISHVISGTAVTNLAPMIPIAGALRFTIDGGVGKFLTFRNTNTTAFNAGPVIQYNNSSQNDLLTNCYIESNATGQFSVSNGAITIGTTGINSVTISSCDIRDARGGTLGSPTTGIYSNSIGNSLTITNNNIYNIKNPATYVAASGIYLPLVANGCTITGNSIYMESGMNPVCPLNGIYIVGSNSHIISGNFIGGQAPSCAGSPYTITGATTFTGISITQFTAPGGTIQGNTIRNITMSNSSASTIFYGINNNTGPILVTGNTIGDPVTPNSIQIAGTGNSAGIYNNNVNSIIGDIFEINTIANITLTSIGSPTLNGMRMYGGTVRRNKIFNIGSSAATATPIIYGIFNMAGLAANEYSNNMIALNGGTATNPTLYGFYDNSSIAGTSGFYYNSINLYGIGTGAASTYAFYRAGAAGYIINNNILSNLRTGGTGKNYSIFSAQITNFISDYNDLYVAGAVLGSWGAVDKANLAAWKAIVIVPPLDQNSLSTLPAFTSNSNLYIVTDPNLVNHGTPVSVTVDIDGLTRCNPPDIGINKFGTCTINLNLTIFLECLYAGAGMMNPATSFDGVNFVPKWGPTIADHVTIELHAAASYLTLVYTATDVPLNTNGTLTVAIPGIYNGSYYVTVKHKNSIETVVSAPILFNSASINYNLSDLSTRAYGGNLKAMPGGVFAIYAGDVSSFSGIYPAAPVKDGVVDLFDDYYVYASFLNGDFGYVPADVNGDGVVDLFDAYLVYNNFLLGIYAITP